MCYSDHNHDIEWVGICEMCGGRDLEYPWTIDRDIDRILG